MITDAPASIKAITPISNICFCKYRNVAEPKRMARNASAKYLMALAAKTTPMK